MVTQESFGAGEKRQGLPLNWLTKLIESFALYISLAGLIGHNFILLFFRSRNGSIRENWKSI